MIQITIFKKPDQSYKGFQVLGHAESVDEGADLVCCAISVLTINLVNSLESFTEEEFEFVQDEETGLIQIMFEQSISDEAALLMKSYELGITTIAPEYDNWLKVIIEEV